MGSCCGTSVGSNTAKRIVAQLPPGSVSVSQCYILFVGDSIGRSGCSCAAKKKLGFGLDWRYAGCLVWVDVECELLVGFVRIRSDA